MLQAIGHDLGKPLQHKDDERYFLHEKLNLLVSRGLDDFPMLSILTINDNLVMEITFNETDIAVETVTRKKIATMDFPCDLSLWNALGLYIRMKEVAVGYVREHFAISKFEVRLQTSDANGPEA